MNICTYKLNTNTFLNLYFDDKYSSQACFIFLFEYYKQYNLDINLKEIIYMFNDKVRKLFICLFSLSLSL